MGASGILHGWSELPPFFLLTPRTFTRGMRLETDWRWFLFGTQVWPRRLRHKADQKKRGKQHPPRGVRRRQHHPRRKAAPNQKRMDSSTTQRKFIFGNKEGNKRAPLQKTKLAHPLPSLPRYGTFRYHLAGPGGPDGITFQQKTKNENSIWNEGRKGGRREREGGRGGGRTEKFN